MSLLPYEFFPRSVFNTNYDDWFNRPLSSSLSPFTRLDLFDPFDELDNLFSRNLRWLNQPEYLRNLPLVPRVPRKYRITCDCAGFTPETIKTEFKDNNKLVVSGTQEENKNEVTGDYSKREFKRTYDIPPNCEKDRMVSFMAGNSLIIEFPIKEEGGGVGGVEKVDLLPKIIDNPDGSKSVQMSLSIPESVDPNKVHVSVKDRDLIVRIEDRQQRPDGSSRFHYYQRTTLPENTRVEQLKCVQDKGMITATAPLGNEPHHSYRNIPIESKQQQQPQLQQSQQQMQQQQTRS